MGERLGKDILERTPVALEIIARSTIHNSQHTKNQPGHPSMARGG